MYVIGLTGGIGSGKSTVAKLLEEYGAAVLSADLVGHEVYQPGRPAWQELVDAFGREVVASDGTIDRKKLGGIVFADPNDQRPLKRLNSITHPRMKGMMRERLAELQQQSVPIAVLEAALLFDADWDDLTDEVWVTVVPPEVAARRTAERGGLAVEQVLSRIQAQMSNEERITRSDIVVDTNCDLEGTARQVEQQWSQLQGRLAAASAQSGV
jgi:dephospho-CoA kinase